MGGSEIGREIKTWLAPKVFQTSSVVTQALFRVRGAHPTLLNIGINNSCG